MPRRKPKGQDQAQALPEEPILALQSPRPSHGGKEHKADPYESLPGAVKSVVTTSVVPINRKMNKRDLALRDEARLEQKMLAERYDHYLDALAEQGGDQIQALSQVFGLSVADVRIRRQELQAEVRRGVGTSSVADTLEKFDLGLVARARVLRSHVYSENPAASLKALDMIQELAGDNQDSGTFESFLRIAKQQKKG